MTSHEQAVTKASETRRLCVPTPYVQKHGVSSESEHNVLNEYCIFMRLDGEGANFEGAIRWDHVRREKTCHPDLYLLQFLLLMCETTKLGTVRILPNHQAQPQEYERACEMYARKSLGKLPQKDFPALMKMVLCDHYVDLKMRSDVDQIKERLRTEQNKKGGAPVAAEAEEEEEEEEEGDGDDVPSPAIAPALAPAAELVAAFMSAAEVMHGNENVSFDNLSYAQLRARHLGVIPQQPPLVPQVSKIVLPKVQMTVTPLPREGVDPKKATASDIVGVLCRFMVHDPEVTCGKFLAMLVENAEQRARAKTSKREGGYHNDLFPAYTRIADTQHPASSAFQKATLFSMCLRYDPTVARSGKSASLYSKFDMQSTSEPTHLLRVASMRRALELMRDAGVAREFLNFPWTAPHDPSVKQFPAALRTYHYHPEQVFWHHQCYVGFRDCMFPHIDNDNDFITLIMNNAKVSELLGEENTGTAAAEARNTSLTADSWLVDKSLLIKSDLVPYHTDNEYVHRYAEACKVNTRLARERPAHAVETLRQVQLLIGFYGREQWRRHIRDAAALRRIAETEKQQPWAVHERARIIAGVPLHTRVEEYDLYVAVVKKSRGVLTHVLESLWQTDGDIDQVPAPDTLRALMKWHQTNKVRLPNMTRGYLMWDRRIGMFGNSILRQLKIYACIEHILQPLICLLTEGLFSCYYFKPKKIAFNLLVHGRYDVGKTYGAITETETATCIPKTTESYTSETPAANSTLKHCYDTIVLQDETDEWMVNDQVAKKHPDQVNACKVIMTSRTNQKKIFTWVHMENGDRKRWAETVYTDHYSAVVRVTNFVVDPKTALASRHYIVTVAQPRIPARLLKGSVGAALPAEGILYLNINQYLSALVYKAIQVGALPDVDMTLFDEMSNNILNALTASAAVCEEGDRKLEIMTPYARQMVVHHAIHCAFDLPSSPNYQKPFQVVDILAVAPYLYCTPEIVWWTWTALASAWIEENRTYVLEAIPRAANFEWPAGVDAYDMYECDIEDGQGFGKIPWRLIPNPNHSGEKRDKDDMLVDLKYITLNGTWQQICQSIAGETRNNLDRSDVDGVLRALERVQIPLPGGGMCPQPRARFRQWHKYKTLPDPDNQIPGTKYTCYADGTGDHQMPPEYADDDFSQPRTKYHVPRDPESTKYYVVDKSEFAKTGNLYIMPQVLDHFRTCKLETALMQVTLCGTMRPSKMLLGIPDEEDAMDMRVCDMSDPVKVDQLITAMDRVNGYNEAGRWVGPADVPETERPVSRRSGILNTTRSGISEKNQLFFTGAPLAPVAAGDTSWKESVQNDIRTMASAFRVVNDLGYDAALRHHAGAGMSLDAPLQDPAFVESEYVRVSEQRNIPWTTNLDYPRDMKRERVQLDSVRERKSTIRKDHEILEAFYSSTRAQSSETAAAAVAENRVPVIRPNMRRRHHQPQGKKRPAEQSPLLTATSTTTTAAAALSSKRPAPTSVYDAMLSSDPNNIHMN